MADIPNEKQSEVECDAGTPEIATQAEDSSASMHQLSRTVANLDLSDTHNHLMDKIANHLERTVKQFEVANNCKPVILEHLRNTLKYVTDKKKSREEKQLVEYVFAPEDRNQAFKRDRLNSCSFSLETATEFLNKMNSEAGAVDVPLDILKLHYCADCKVEISVGDGETTFSAIFDHFSNDPHKPIAKPAPKAKQEIVLPKLSRKMAAMINAEPTGIESNILTENDEYIAMLTNALLTVEPGQYVDVESLIPIYKTMTSVLMTNVFHLDLSMAGKFITPVLVSIKDNLSQTSFDNAKSNDEEDDTLLDDSNAKGEPKRLKFYQPIATMFDEFLDKHKLISLADERSGKPAYFCIPCEFYTLRFGYDVILSHVLSDTHVQQLSNMLSSDGYILHSFGDTGSPNEIEELSKKFLSNDMWISTLHQADDSGDSSYLCKLCNRLAISGFEAMLAHVFDESHMGKVSGKFFFKMRDDKTVNWGKRYVNWKMFNSQGSKGLSADDPIVLENFLKPMAKTLSHCQCCSMTLKGQQQVVFNHVRQKKHVRNAIPRRLAVAFGNSAHPLEFFSTLGHYYCCVICEDYSQSVMMYFSDIYEHVKTDAHLNTVAKLLRLYSGNYTAQDWMSLMRQSIFQTDLFNCLVCGVQFATLQDVISHIFTDVDHQSNVATRDRKIYKPHMLNYIVKGSPIAFINNAYVCTVCNLGMTTGSELLAHLSLADHILDKLQPEEVFRFYLLLKNNTKTCKENSIVVHDQTTVECQKCKSFLSGEENVRSHIASAGHKG